MTPTPPSGRSEQQARTLLAWRRTALSLVAAGVLAGRLTVDRAGRAQVSIVLLTLAVLVTVAWLVPLRQPAAAGLCLAGGVVVLAGLLLSALVSA